jgi:hypothetical protein
LEQWRLLRAAQLTADDVEALLHLRVFIDSDEERWPSREPLTATVLAVLDKLLARGGGE